MVHLLDLLALITDCCCCCEGGSGFPGEGGGLIGSTAPRGSTVSFLPSQPATTMDYEGQKLSELLFHIIILAFGGVGWIFGYFAQDFSYVFYAWAAGTAISVVVSFGDEEASPSRVGRR